MPYAAKNHSTGPSVAKVNARAYDARRANDPTTRFVWTSGWKRFRAWFLAQHPLCVRCEHQGKTTTANTVHHIKPRRDHPQLALEPSNCMALCEACHNRIEKSGVSGDASLSHQSVKMAGRGRHKS